MKIEAGPRIYTASPPHVLVDPLEQIHHLYNPPPMEGLINRSSTAPERTSLIPAIFSTPDVVEKVRGLEGDDIQTFVDVIDEASP